MISDRPIVSPRSLALRILGVLFVSACASAPVAAPKTQVRLEPLTAAPDTASPAPLPALPSIGGDVALSDRASVRRLSTLSVTNQDVSAVVRELATKFGMQYQVDPAVRGTVNANLKNATLQEALAAVVPQGATYQVQDNVIRVGPARLLTRIFSLDYVALSRVGTASTVIQRRLGANATGANAFSSANTASVGSGIAGSGGADFITAVSVADVWEEIRVATEALVFDAPAGGAQSTATQTPGLAPGAANLGSTGRPYSRVSPDGRRLIINPIAGTITITALAGQLDEVDLFIRTFESSIQRQVLIEAKIVEVNLDRTFEFGIDWNAVARAGTAGITVRSSTTPRSTGNVEFTLSGGAGQITTVLNALETQGDVRVLSSPRVSALNNQRAVFDVTTGEIVFQARTTLIPNPGGGATPVTEVTPQQVNVGIVLDVLPQIGADNTVTMNIRPVVTSVARTATFSRDGTVFEAPVIDTRETDTMARLRGNETIIIGGLMQTRRERVRSGVPGLRSIPLLGRLFTSYRDVERKAELVIFLTPTIIAGQPVAPR
jgi:MSHA type pilus biogenesis protein MshL